MTQHRRNRRRRRSAKRRAKEPGITETTGRQQDTENFSSMDNVVPEQTGCDTCLKVKHDCYDEAPASCTEESSATLEPGMRTRDTITVIQATAECSIIDEQDIRDSVEEDFREAVQKDMLKPPAPAVMARTRSSQIFPYNMHDETKDIITIESIAPVVADSETSRPFCPII